MATESDLTYADFVKLRAQALRSLHAAQYLKARIVDPRYTVFVPGAIETADEAVKAAELLLASLLDRWARSKYNRSE